MQGQQAELEAAAITLATASVAGDAASHRDYKAGMKPPRPANFNGKKKGLQNFLLQLDVYALLARQHWTEKGRVLHAMMFFTKAATNWIQSYLCTAWDNQDVLMLANYSLFTAKITCVFGVYDKVATANQKLEKLRQ